jgi:hypothetical protein
MFLRVVRVQEVLICEKIDLDLDTAERDEGVRDNGTALDSCCALADMPANRSTPVDRLASCRTPEDKLEKCCTTSSLLASWAS